MNTDRAARAFVAVDDGVVGLRPDLTEQVVLGVILYCTLEHLEIFVHRRGEWMVRGEISVALLIMFEHRELGDDERLVTTAVNKSLTTADLVTQRTQCRSNDR